MMPPLWRMIFRLPQQSWRWRKGYIKGLSEVAKTSLIILPNRLLIILIYSVLSVSLTMNLRQIWGRTEKGADWRAELNCCFHSSSCDESHPSNTVQYSCLGDICMYLTFFCGVKTEDKFVEANQMSFLILLGEQFILMNNDTIIVQIKCRYLKYPNLRMRALGLSSKSFLRAKILHKFAASLTLEPTARSPRLQSSTDGWK